MSKSIDTTPLESYTESYPYPTGQYAQEGNQVLQQQPGGRTAGATLEEGQVADEQREGAPAPQAGFDEIIARLPAVGTREYWQCIEQTTAEERLSLEMLAHCLRAHMNEGQRMDAERVFVALLKRLQPQIQYWAYTITQQSRDALSLGLATDLVQECAFALWKELSEVKHTFILVNFAHTLKRIEQNVAHRFMEQAGQWKRAKTTRPKRIQRGNLERLESKSSTEDPMRQAEQVHDVTAETAFNQVELLHDLNTLLHSFNRRDRIIVYDRFWRGLTEVEIAEELRITDRTVRNALKRVLSFLRTQYYEEV